MKAKLLTSILFVFFLSVLANSQAAIDGVVSDFGGGWRSESTALSAVRPNNHHDMLAFKVGSTWYSTGVNDSIVSAQLGATPFVSGDWAALAASSATALYVGQGSAADGDVSTGVAMVYPVTGGNVTQYISDGTKGLDLSTFANNVAGTFVFPIAQIEMSAVGDGVPDFMVVNAAVPSNSSIIYNLYNSAGTLIATAGTGSLSALAQFANNANDRFR
ncbi:MAG: hypothetical protein ACK5NT_14200, partial [Pyrinomonadaceae bacterium]